MFQRIFLSAIGAGLAVGIVMAGIHQVTTVPLVQEAEKYEKQAGAALLRGAPAQGMVIKAALHGSDLLTHVHGDAHAPGDGAAWAPEDGLERIFYSSLATILISVGFALLLTGGFALSGRAVEGREGVVWGMGAFAAFTLAPALGLAPELPGSAAAEIVARQTWWLGTAVATAAGLAGLVFSPSWALRGLAAGLILLPHIIGAPHAHGFTSTVPAELAGEFAARSIVVSAVFFALLGWASGTLYSKLQP